MKIYGLSLYGEVSVDGIWRLSKLREDFELLVKSVVVSRSEVGNVLDAPPEVHGDL